MASILGLDDNHLQLISLLTVFLLGIIAGVSIRMTKRYNKGFGDGRNFDTLTVDELTKEEQLRFTRKISGMLRQNATGGTIYDDLVIVGDELFTCLHEEHRYSKDPNKKGTRLTGYNTRLMRAFNKCSRARERCLNEERALEEAVAEVPIPSRHRAGQNTQGLTGKSATVPQNQRGHGGFPIQGSTPVPVHQNQRTRGDIPGQVITATPENPNVCNPYGDDRTLNWRGTVVPSVRPREMTPSPANQLCIVPMRVYRRRRPSRS
jgi:hypothetical protein